MRFSKGIGKALKIKSEPVCLSRLDTFLLFCNIERRVRLGLAICMRCAHCASVCRKQRKMLRIFYQLPLFYFSAAGFSTEPRAKLATSKACQFFCPLPMVLGSRQHVEAFHSDPHPTQQALGPWIYLTSPLHGEMSLRCGFISR